MLESLRVWFSRKYTQPAALAITRVAARAVNRYALDDQAYSIFHDQGFHLLRRSDYNLPIPEEDDLDEAFWANRSQMIGIEMNDQCALGFLAEIFPRYLDEFRGMFPLHSAGDTSAFYLINGSFMAIDAHVYYCFIRHFKPKRIVEIGSGRSTQVAGAACLRNAQEQGQAPNLTSIEPFPPPYLNERVPGISQLIIDKVQHVDMEVFTSLESGDILFIDSTHALRAGGDVQFEYCEILPRLAPGVLVHIHDISLPSAYPRVYFEKDRHYWNEQYVLQTFLTYNSRFEVIWPGNYMMLNYPEEVCAVFPEYHAMREAYPMSEPASFWMQIAEADTRVAAPAVI